MIFTCRQIIWTPVFGRNSLSIALDRSFAGMCRAHKQENMQRFSNAVWQSIGPSRLTQKPSNFLDIQEGILPKAFYAGRDGLWLSLEAASTRPEEPLIYNGHNEDRHSADLQWLMRAFSAWASGAMTVLNWE